MLIKHRETWSVAEREVTPEHVFLNRRAFVTRSVALGSFAVAGGVWASLPEAALAAAESDPSAALYPAKRNPAYTIEGEVTPEVANTNYNNFYEFSTSKHLAAEAEALKTRPWSVAFDGLVDKPREVAIDDLVKAMPLEERLYRHRCVEAWGMTVPWTGFPLKALVDYAKPLGSAKFVQFTTFLDPKMARGQKSFFYSWPYVEGVTMAEASNDLAFMVTGAYGKPLPKAMGAPIRLALPWKYGFKSAKSIVRITFLEKRPSTFWQGLAANEYGFWANVNPDVPHPRWSQATEEVLGTGSRKPTIIYNGYGEKVASLYVDVKGENIFM